MQCPSCGHENLPGADECEVCQTSLTQEDIPTDDLLAARTRLERSLIEDTVADLKPAPPISVASTVMLAEAIRTMQEKSIGCVLVTGADGKLAGIFSERDVLHRLAIEEVDLEQQTIDSMMTPEPETARLEHPLAHAIHRMIVGDHRHLPLVDTAGCPTGIVSLRDIVNHLATLLPVTASK
jgi:CBS domain-containing protein